MKVGMMVGNGGFMGAESYGQQFTDIVDTVIGLHRSPGAYSMGSVSYDRAKVNDILFMRGQIPIGNLQYEGMPVRRIVALIAGNKLAVAETYPDTIERSHLHKAMARYALSRQMAHTITTRNLDAKESERVIDWLQAPFTTPDITDIFYTLSPEEERRINAAQERARLTDIDFDNTLPNPRPRYQI